jgi:hypothetical protein
MMRGHPAADLSDRTVGHDPFEPLPLGIDTQVFAPSVLKKQCFNGKGILFL